MIFWKKKSILEAVGLGTDRNNIFFCAYEIWVNEEQNNKYTH